MPSSLACLISALIARQVAFVLIIDRDRHEFQRRSLGLGHEERGVGKAEIAPAFAELGFHVLDQQIEILNIARNRAGHDRRRFRLQRCHVRHCLTSFL